MKQERDEKGRFVKGTTLFRGITKGRKLTNEQKNKISESMKRLYKEGKLKIGCFGKKVSEETKEKLRKNAKNNPNYGMRGKTQTQYAKERLRITNLNKIIPKEIRNKISKTLKGRMPKNIEFLRSDEIKTKLRKNASRYWLGKHHSLQTINKIKEFRKKQILPIIDTKIEIKIQNYLKELGINFITHHYIREIEHSYQCDIFIPSLNLIIECDGIYWHNLPNKKYLDIIRTKELIKKGYNILRLWEDNIIKLNIDEFKTLIVQYKKEEEIDKELGYVYA